MDTNKAQRIVARLFQHGQPVQKTTTGFELSRGEFLCRMTDMSALRTMGLVEKGADDRYSLTAAGKALADQVKPGASSPRM